MKIPVTRQVTMTLLNLGVGMVEICRQKQQEVLQAKKGNGAAGAYTGLQHEAYCVEKAMQALKPLFHTGPGNWILPPKDEEEQAKLEKEHGIDLTGVKYWLPDETRTLNLHDDAKDGIYFIIRSGLDVSSPLRVNAIEASEYLWPTAQAIKRSMSLKKELGLMDAKRDAIPDDDDPIFATPTEDSKEEQPKEAAK